MVPHSSVTDKEIEDLLAIVEGNPVVKVKFEDTEVEKFILELKLVAGETKVPAYHIYYKYWLWKKKRNCKSRAQFFKQFKKTFKKITMDDGAGYLLNPEPFDLTQHGYFKARALMRREKSERRKKDKKTIKR